MSGYPLRAQSLTGAYWHVWKGEWPGWLLGCRGGLCRLDANGAVANGAGIPGPGRAPCGAVVIPELERNPFDPDDPASCRSCARAVSGGAS